MRSAGWRFFIVGILAVLMFIPLGLISDIVNDRSRYSQDTVRSLSNEWGGNQLFSGPQMVIPVEEEVTYDRRRVSKDPGTGQPRLNEDGEEIYEYFQETVIEDRAPVFLYPDEFTITIDTKTQIRKRGLFQVPVYTSDLKAAFDFPAARAEELLKGEERLRWDNTEVRVYLTANRALRGEAVLLAGADSVLLEPLSINQGDNGGVFARIGDPRQVDMYDLSLATNGAQSLFVAAVGRTTDLTITSDWPHPSFSGDFLPDDSEISDAGFMAKWTIPHLARNLPQVSRENPDGASRSAAKMGLRFITPNDFYQKAYRSARYGILFIALTFLTILLLDRTAEPPAHPVQYLLVGLAQSVFVLLMLAYSEQIGFALAYLVASGATIALLVMFAVTAMKMGRRSLVLATMLIVLYAVLYLILQSADYALIAGSTLAFVALAATMFLTRNENWYGPPKDPNKLGFFGRLKQPTPPPAQAPVPTGSQPLPDDGPKA